jgi:myo-inositol-1(or 4)-monophosphatase
MRPETEAALAAAEIAQRIADSREGADLVTAKSGIDLVTNTDIACEDAIRAELSSRFPQYPVIGEERGGRPTNAKSYWLVDPICGTRPFASGIPLYCTNIALVESGVVTVAAVAVGKTGEILYAEKDNGAKMRTPRSEVTLQVKADSNMVAIEGAGSGQHAAATIHNALLLRRWYVCLYNSTVSYAYAAIGRMAAVINFGVPTTETYGSVHTAAGCLVAAEAGAIVTDIDTYGGWSLSTQSLMIAATQSLHDELCEVIAKANIASMRPEQRQDR